MLVATSVARRVADGRFHARILLGSFSDRSRIVNDVSYVTRISHDSHFAWQAQYSVMLGDDTCCSAHCK